MIERLEEVDWEFGKIEVKAVETRHPRAFADYCLIRTTGFSPYIACKVTCHSPSNTWSSAFYRKRTPFRVE